MKKKAMHTAEGFGRDVMPKIEALGLKLMRGGYYDRAGQVCLRGALHRANGGFSGNYVESTVFSWEEEKAMEAGFEGWTGSYYNRPKFKPYYKLGAEIYRRFAVKS